MYFDCFHFFMSALVSVFFINDIVYVLLRQIQMKIQNHPKSQTTIPWI